MRKNVQYVFIIRKREGIQKQTISLLAVLATHILLMNPCLLICQDQWFSSLIPALSSCLIFCFWRSSPCGGSLISQLMAGCWFIARMISGIWAALLLQRCVATLTQRPRIFCHRWTGKGRRTVSCSFYLTWGGESLISVQIFVLLQHWLCAGVDYRSRWKRVGG